MRAKFMTFRLETETYGLEISKVRELIGLIDVTRVPGAPPFVRGVINLRGKVMPVVDLRLKLGMPETVRGEQTVIMVVHTAAGPMGLLVDEVLDVLALAADQIEPASCVSAAAFDASLLAGIGKLDQRLIFLIDLERVLASGALEQRAP